MVEKLFKTIPFLLYVLLILIPLIAYRVSENLFIITVIFYTVYGLYKAFTLLAGLIIGYYHYRYEKKVNWLDKAKELNIDLPNHIISIPVYLEDVSTILRQLHSLKNQNYPLANVNVVISIEPREDFVDIKAKIEKDFFGSFKNLLIVEHNIEPRSVKGAASNRTNAAKVAKSLMQDLGYNIKNFLITSPDADTVFHKDYLARTSFAWIQDKFKNNVFYQTGDYRLDNNLNNVPLIIQILSTGISVQTLSSSVVDSRYTFSCFTMPFQAIIDFDYWDTTLALDDSPFYWRAYKHFQGDFNCSSIYIPVSVDSIESNNWLKTHLLQYKQIYRWGWGIMVFPSAIRYILGVNTNFLQKFLDIWRFVDSMILSKALPLIIIVILSTMRTSIEIVPTLSLLSLFFIVLSLVWVFKLLLENSKISYLNKFIIFIFFLPFGLFNLFIYCFMPFLHSAAELALGKNGNQNVKWSIKMPVN